MVTLLFTDIVASTELSSRLGPGEADRVRQAHFSLLRQALAGNEGSEVKNLGDGLMAVFRSPSGAIACAVAMQQAVDQDNRRSAEALGLRVGLSCGEATVEDSDYFGDPVVEAARICALSEGGQILTAESVKTMAGRRCPHPFIALGERDLKGLPDPVSICEVHWEPTLRTTGVPLPDRLETPGGLLFGFVGRESELEGLLAATKHTTEGVRTVTFLSGEPGIGKTTLCRQLARSAQDLGVCVLYGRCDEDLGGSYQPFAEALTNLVVHCDESLLSDHVAENGGALLSLVPALSKRLPDVQPAQSGDPDSERMYLFGAVVNLLSLASAEGGLLLVIDDLHWADRASLQLLRHVCASHQLPKVMVLGTYRGSELSAGNVLSDTLASIRREGNADRIDLRGLEDFEILAMMEQVAGHVLEQEGVDLAHAVRRETDGNPFFTTELLRHLAETGLIYRDDSGRWAASEDLYERGLPQSVREVVGQRVDRLGEETRNVLSLAAVIGRDFDIDVLAVSLGIDEDTLLDIIEPAVTAALLVEVEGSVDRYGFAHALTQHTLYEDLGASRRARAHRKIAGVLEDLYGTAPGRAAELARHFVAATKTADTMKALTYSKIAGEQALAQLAPADALGLFAQALDLYPQIPPDESLHCDLLIGLGTAQRRTGDPAFRRTLLDSCRSALALGDDMRLLTAAMANSRGWSSNIGDVDPERIEILETTLERLVASTTERALALAALCKELTYGTAIERRKALGDEAAAIVTESADDVIAVRVFNDLALALCVPHLLDDSLVRTADALARAERLGDPVLLFFAAVWRAQTLGLAGDLAGRDHYTEVATGVAARLGEPILLWSDLNNRVVCAMSRGDVEEADRLTQAALAVGTESGQPDAALYFSGEQLAVCWQRGTLGELGELIESTMSDTPQLASVISASLALSHHEGGRFDAAEQMIDALGEKHYDLPIDQTWLTAVVDYAQIAVERNLPHHAGPLRELLLPWEETFACTGITVAGHVSHYLAGLSMVLGEFEEADRLFARADAFNRDVGGKFFIASTALWWGRLAAERTDRPELVLAHQRLTASHELATEQGYVNIVARAAAALERLS
jgi:class 3 adenylate cyclase